MNLRAAVGAQEPITWIDAGGTRLAAMRRGTGTPVLCLHAIGHGARDFEALAARIGDGFEIVALDWPAQGASPDDGIAAAPDHYADLAVKAMDALGIARAILLGNSVGGAAALRIAARHPQRVQALVLCNSGGLAGVTATGRFVIRRLAAFFGAGERRRGWYRWAFGVYYRQVLVRPPSFAQRARIVASAYEIAKPLRQAWESFARPGVDVRALVPRVTCPVWLAWAKDDKIIPWKDSKRAARDFPHARVQLFEGSHAAFLEDPDRFAEAFRLFASSI
ncbi:MAG TPA: alpha/beta hydrolase [Rhizomicrobium sp.]|nr:alpha/beta hydrolase [Rhizomicrobium sp.]